MKFFPEIKILICGLFVCMFSITPLSTQDVDLDEICQGMPNGTYVPDPLACESFYLCLTGKTSTLCSSTCKWI